MDLKPKRWVIFLFPKRKASKIDIHFKFNEMDTSGIITIIAVSAGALFFYFWELKELNKKITDLEKADELVKTALIVGALYVVAKFFDSK